MSEFNIETSQNVELKLKSSDFGDRIIATIIDMIVISAYLFIIFYFLGGLFRINLYSEYTVLTIIYSPVLFYNLILESLFDGQSPGKKVMKIKVVKLDGSQITFMDHFIRWIFRFVDLMFAGGVGIIIMIINGKGQRLGDIVAKTTVASVKNDESLHRSIYQDLEKNYEIQFQEVHLLSDKDIQIIKNVLEATRTIQSNEQWLAIKRLSEKVKEKLRVKTEIPDRKFLITIVKDYNKMYS